MCDNGGGGSKREEMKKLIKQLRKVYDKVDMNIYNSTKNVNLNTIISYVKDGKTYHFMDDYNKRGRKIMNSSKYCLITTTFENKEEANKISEILLKKRLVSCSQISSITSSYHWKGKIEHEEEFLLQMKSKTSLYKEIESEILKYHSYETPQIIMYEIKDGYSEYLKWIDDETKEDNEKCIVLASSNNNKLKRI